MSHLRNSYKTMKHVIGKSQHEFTKGKSCQTGLITFYNKVTFCPYGVSSGCCLPGLQLSIQHCFSQPPPRQTGKIQTGWVVCEMARKLAHGMHSEGGDWWFSFRLAAWHKWGLPGIDAELHAVWHLHKWSGQQHWRQPHQVAGNAELSGEVDAAEGRAILQR